MIDEFSQWLVRQIESYAYNQGVQDGSKKREAEIPINQFKEIISSVVHEIWAYHVNSFIQKTETVKCGTVISDGDLVIKKEIAESWIRKISIRYSCLREQEKKQDREQADKIIKAIMEVK